MKRNANPTDFSIKTATHSKPKIDWLAPDVTKAGRGTPRSATKKRVPYSLSMQEFADQVGVSRKTVNRRVLGGDLRFYRLGRTIRIAEEDAYAFLAARRE